MCRANLPRHSNPITYPKSPWIFEDFFNLNMFYVYILFTERFNKFYIGQTNSIENRLNSHNNGFVKSTKPFAPYKLILVIEKKTRSEAMILEKKLKNLNTEDLKKFIAKYS